MEALVAHAETDTAIRRCFPIMSQLRPRLLEAEFAKRIVRQQQQGYRLAYVEAASEIRAVAGYRFAENLAWGRFCYVDDLVTDVGSRSQGFGRTLFAWLLARARDAGCEQFHLDSGVHRFEAHRFYLAQRMAISSHHFSLTLADERAG